MMNNHLPGNGVLSMPVNSCLINDSNHLLIQQLVEQNRTMTKKIKELELSVTKRDECISLIFNRLKTLETTVDVNRRRCVSSGYVFNPLTQASTSKEASVVSSNNAEIDDTPNDPSLDNALGCRTPSNSEGAESFVNESSLDSVSADEWSMVHCEVSLSRDPKIDEMAKKQKSTQVLPVIASSSSSDVIKRKSKSIIKSKGSVNLSDGSGKPVAVESSSKKHLCTVCAKSFTSLSHVRRHMLIHGPKNFNCDFGCGKSFFQHWNRTAHHRTCKHRLIIELTKSE